MVQYADVTVGRLVCGLVGPSISASNIKKKQNIGQQRNNDDLREGELSEKENSLKRITPRAKFLSL